MTFAVRRTACATCIYRDDSPLDLEKLESEVRDKHGFMVRWRICHHDDPPGVCCRGYWNRHADEFPAGQLAQRLGLVRFVSEQADRPIQPGADHATIQERNPADDQGGIRQAP